MNFLPVKAEMDGNWLGRILHQSPERFLFKYAAAYWPTIVWDEVILLPDLERRSSISDSFYRLSPTSFQIVEEPIEIVVFPRCICEPEQSILVSFEDSIGCYR